MWNQYRPKDVWYLHKPLGIHGLGHASRVLVWGNLIGLLMQQEQGISVDLEVVHWAATLHDVRRINDGKDWLHGERCSEWINGLDVKLLHKLTNKQRQQIAYCCRWHVPPDSEAPKLTPELICLKDADALDRVRLGSLNLDFLRTSFARNLVDQAQFLCDLSETQSCYLNDPWLGVEQAAQRMAVWVPDRIFAFDTLHQHLKFFAS
jgi:hypothetical protein